MFLKLSESEFCHLEIGMMIPLEAAVMTVTMPCTVLGTKEVFNTYSSPGRSHDRLISPEDMSSGMGSLDLNPGLLPTY